MIGKSSACLAVQTNIPRINVECLLLEMIEDWRYRPWASPMHAWLAGIGLDWTLARRRRRASTQTFPNVYSRRDVTHRPTLAITSISGKTAQVGDSLGR